MSPEERARVVEALPAEVTWDEMAMPEGDLHSLAKLEAVPMLRSYFSRQHRRVYIGTELPVYYPAERRFAPDMVAVLDVETHLRGKWVVSHEGKGLDWVLEVHVGGDRKKDAEFNVSRYARLGIPEYFIFDRARVQLLGYRLPRAGAREYVPMKPRKGRYVSRRLGLELGLVEGRLRFYDGTGMLLDAEEMRAHMEQLVRKEHQRADEEVRLRRKAQRKAAEAERRAAELQAELERLERGRS
ncbi:Uma2 family endonuclease [Archangium sp.]|uniref:Uma2 family endonuclease n=1 Tax=Archangium sp. TaxID=1872627 RepID=UPI00389B1D93